MRILFLQDHLRIGGTEKQALALSSFGQILGNEIGLIIFRPGGGLKIDPSKVSFFNILQPFNTRIDEWAPGLIGNIRKFQPEVIIFMGKVSHLYCERIRRHFPGITLIATFRSGKPPVPYYARALFTAHGVITNSQIETNRLKNSFSIPERQLKTVHNGCLISKKIVSTPSTSLNHLRVLYVAMFRPQKNQQELLSILSHLPDDIDWKCTLVGTGKTLKTCKEHAIRLEIQDRVTFTGQSEPECYYKNHDVAVLTSDKEGLPNSLIEAQCAGIPVVAYLVNGVKECFQEGVSGFGIPYRNQHGFLDALTLLARDPEKRITMGKAAYEFGNKQFGFEKQSTDFFEAVKQLHASRS